MLYLCKSLRHIAIIRGPARYIGRMRALGYMVLVLNHAKSLFICYIMVSVIILLFITYSFVFLLTEFRGTFSS
jgi:hypothetical protein